MKRPRFTIANLMGVVVLIALACGLLRSVLRSMVGGSRLSDLLSVGALPMVLILLIGLVALWRWRADRGRSRPVCVGFLVFGTLALALFVLGSLVATIAIHDAVGDLVQSFRVNPGPVFLGLASCVLVLPQLGLAILGGWLGGRYRIQVRVVVQRRQASEPDAPVAIDPAPLNVRPA